MLLQVLPILLGGLAGPALEAEHIALEDEQLGGPRPAYLRGMLDDGVQHCPGVGDVTGERREDLRARVPATAST